MIAERPTLEGIANLDYLLEARAGNFRITVVAGTASASQEVDIVIGESAIVSVYTPTPSPTQTPAPTSTPSPTLTPTITPSPTATNTPIPTATIEAPLSTDEDPLDEFNTDWTALLGLGGGLLIVTVVGYWLSQSTRKDLANTMGHILWGLAGSLLAYIYFTLGLPGSELLSDFGDWAGFLSTVVGGLVGLLVKQLPFLS